MFNRVQSVFTYLHNKGFFDLLVARFLMQFLGLGTVLLVARMLTPKDLGDIKIIQSYTSLFSLLAGFGFSAAVLKICSERSSMDDKEIVLRHAFWRSLITSAITLILLTILAYTRIITPTAHIARWLLVYSISIPIAVTSELLVVFLQAQKKIKLMARVQSIVKVQSVIIIVLCTWKWSFQGFVLSTIIAYAAGLIPLVSQVHLSFLTKRATYHNPLFMNYAIFSMLGNLVSQIGQRGDLFILDHFSTNREIIGYYALASIFFMAAIQATGVVQQILVPYFSEHSSDHSWITKHIDINVKRMTLLGLAIAISTFGAAWFIIYAFFDPSYFLALRYLAVLLVSYCIFSTYAVVWAAMVGLGFMRFKFCIVAISTPLTLLLMYIGLQRFGIVGLAWSSVAASSIKALLTFCLLPIVLKMSPGNMRQVE